MAGADLGEHRLFMSAEVLAMLAAVLVLIGGMVLYHGVTALS